MTFLSHSTLEGQRLLVIDNVDDPTLKLAPFFPRWENGAVIVTSRNSSRSQLSPNAHLQLALDTNALYTMLRDVAGQVPELLQEGTVVLERGTADQLRTFIGCFDRPSKRLPALAAR